MSNITNITHSDDPLTLMRGMAEKINDLINNEESASASVREALDDLTTRLKYLEDKSNNPARREWFMPGDTDQTMGAKREMGAWLKGILRMKSDIAWRDTPDGVKFRDGQVTDVDADGGYLTPTTILPWVSGILEQHGVARQICRTVPVTTGKTDIGTLATKPLVYWASQNAEPTLSKITFGKKDLDTDLLIAIDKLSLAFEEDTAPALTEYTVDVFMRAIAKEEDKQAFGTGTSPFTGLFAETGTGAYALGSGTTTWVDNLAYEDFVKIMQKCDVDAVTEGRWLMSRDVYFEVMNVRDSQNRPLWNMSLGDGAPGTLLGRPISISNVLPGTAQVAAGVPFIAYGDFQHLYIIDRRRLAVDFSGGDAGFTSASRYLRLMERVGFYTMVPEAFAVAKTGAA